METTQLLISRRMGRNFLGAPVVKNPPFNARNMGLIILVGEIRSYMPWGN